MSCSNLFLLRTQIQAPHWGLFYLHLVRRQAAQLVIPWCCDVGIFATDTGFQASAALFGILLWPSHLKIRVPNWSWSNLDKRESSRGKSSPRTMWFYWKDPGSRLISTSVSPAVTLKSIDLQLASSLSLFSHSLFQSWTCPFSSPAQFLSTPLKHCFFSSPLFLYFTPPLDPPDLDYCIWTSIHSPY